VLRGILSNQVAYSNGADDGRPEKEPEVGQTDVFNSYFDIPDVSSTPKSRIKTIRN